MKIAIGCDHAGYEIKLAVMEWMHDRGHEAEDFGTYSMASVDYPDFVHPVAKEVEAADYDFGVLVCGSGQGVTMTANKYAGIRAALCWIPEIASMTRKHNDANILCIPGRYVDRETAFAILDAFFSTEFEGGRHQNRINKIPK